MASFTIRDLTFTYPDMETPALDRLTLTVEAGEFLILAGPSGCGKTTLLRQLKSALTPHGTRLGELLYDGTPLEQVDERTQAARIGFVLQDPDSQLVTDRVWHELAFGPESLGWDTATIRRRVAEIAEYFGIGEWFHKDVTELSGGQKQQLNLAAVMVTQPDVLILDEPTSQLDPIAASGFLATVGRICRELGVTVVLTEHRLEDVFPLCDRVAVLDRGQLLCTGTPSEVGEKLRGSHPNIFLSMPAPMRVYASVPNDLPCPVSARDGRVWLEMYANTHPLGQVPPETVRTHGDSPAVELREVWFRYERELPDVLRGMSLKVYPGELYALMGGNGTGKTTALSLISGLQKPYRGEVYVDGVRRSELRNAYDALLGVLPQDPSALFVKSSVGEDLFDAVTELPVSEREERVRRTAALCRLGGLLARHPYDLSGGERQRAALAKVLLRRPRILLLDEPTKGMDAAFKRELAGILRQLTEHGAAVLMASHDVEFCAMYADRCALSFDGGIVAEDTPRAFFSGNSYYTTTVNRMARGQLPDAVTVNDLVAACGGTPDYTPPGDAPEVTYEPVTVRKRREKLPVWRRVLAWVSGGTAAGCFLWSLRGVNLTELLRAESFSASLVRDWWLYAVLLASLGLLSFAVAGRKPERTAPIRGKLSRRTVITACVTFALIPLTILAGVFLLGDRKYYFISLLVILETLLPFALIFEGRRPKARELVILAVLCALGVAGRAAFAALPGFKPVLAVVILTGAAFSGESGFLVGAMTMLSSNVLFGQGPWTPWQMFAMGLCGFLAGILYRKGLLSGGRVSLSVYGILAALLYGAIMNPATVLIYQSAPNIGMFLTAYLTGLPIDLLHAAATAFFLWVLGEPVLDKLERVKRKYGLTES